MRTSRLAAGAWILAGCHPEAPTCDSEARTRAPTEDGADPGNVLVLVLDDIGVDKIGAYEVHPTPSRTPRLDALIREGVRFDRAYASPSCSPSRASILTGRHPSRHGIGEWIAPYGDRFTLPESELTFAELAAGEGWSTAAVGKWHLSVYDDHRPELDPQRQGFDRYRGTLGNPDMAVDSDGERRGYWHWERVDDGELSFSDRYLTTAQVDDALELAATLPEPWAMYVAFSAAHTPLDRPPPELAIPASDSEPDRYDAVVEALDSEIGRLLDGMGELRERTTIVTIGDNGTAKEAIRAPWDPDRGKLTMYEEGIRVPLAVSGPEVGAPGASSEALVHAVDVFATVADRLGVDLEDLPDPVDGLSLLPWVRDPSEPGARRCLLVEQFAPDGDRRREMLDRAVIEADHKLIRRRHEPDEILRVGIDPSSEAPSDDRQARARLRDELRGYERALR